MPSHKAITDALARRLSAKKGQQLDNFDQQYPGLCLRVSHRRKVWSAVDRVNGQQRKIWLGLYPSMSVAAAHDEWRRVQADIQNGRDPAPPELVPAAPVPSSSFELVFEDWMKRDQAKNRSAKIQRRSIEKDVLPHWFGRNINSIGRRDCLDVIDRLVDRGIPSELGAFMVVYIGCSSGHSAAASSQSIRLPASRSRARRSPAIAS